MESKSDSENYEKLAEMKMPLILSDYKNWFDAASREYDKINQIRSWEITLVSALSVVLLTTKDISLIASVPIFFIIVTFALLEAQTRAIIRMISDETLELENKMQATSVMEFQKNMAYWTFGNSIVSRQETKEKYKHLFRTLFKPSFALWHGGLLIAVAGVVIILAIV